MGKPYHQEVLAQIIERTDGVPLFVEELTKAILESGSTQARRWALRTDRVIIHISDSFDITGLPDGTS